LPASVSLGDDEENWASNPRSDRDQDFEKSVQATGNFLRLVKEYAPWLRYFSSRPFSVTALCGHFLRMVVAQSSLDEHIRRAFTAHRSAPIQQILLAHPNRLGSGVLVY
jgi:hypothetical protein